MANDDGCCNEPKGFDDVQTKLDKIKKISEDAALRATKELIGIFGKEDQEKLFKIKQIETKTAEFMISEFKSVIGTPGILASYFCLGLCGTGCTVGCAGGCGLGCQADSPVVPIADVVVIANAAAAAMTRASLYAKNF